MKTLISALVSVAFLSGCAAVPALTVAGGGASIFTAVQVIDKDADALLAADAPIKRMICADEHPRPGSKFGVWCAHIPTNVGELALQWAAVAEYH